MATNKAVTNLLTISREAGNSDSALWFADLKALADDALPMAHAMQELCDAAMTNRTLHIDGCRCPFCEKVAAYSKLRGPLPVNGS